MSDYAFKVVSPAPADSNLPRLMRADCGHYIPDGSQPVGEYREAMSGRWLPVYLCPACIPRREAIAEIKRGPGRPRKNPIR